MDDGGATGAGGHGVVGIVGPVLREVAGPRRFGRFADFQRHAGEMEAAPVGGYRAGHAACHALMNGVSRVVLGPVEDDGRARPLAEAVARLMADQPVDILVVPGLVDPPLVRAVVEAFGDAAVGHGPGPAGRLPTLWLDAPDGSQADDVLEYRRSLGGDARRVRVVMPHVPTITPGRRQWERLPPSCLVAPLHLGTTPYLRGVHEADDFQDIEAARRLHRAGCGLLVPVGVRRAVRLAFPLPMPPPRSEDDRAPDDEPTDPLVAELRPALADACAPLLDGAPNTPSLWKSLERTCASVLMAYVKSDAIAGFVVRCDPDTNEGSPDNPVVEVILKRHRPVRDVVVRLTMAG
jgi:hypothetical protein